MREKKSVAKIIEIVSQVKKKSEHKRNAYFSHFFISSFA